MRSGSISVVTLAGFKVQAIEPWRRELSVLQAGEATPTAVIHTAQQRSHLREGRERVLGFAELDPERREQVLTRTTLAHEGREWVLGFPGLAHEGREGVPKPKRHVHEGRERVLGFGAVDREGCAVVLGGEAVSIGE